MEIDHEENKVAANNVLFEPAIYAAQGNDLDDAMGDSEIRSNKTNPGGNPKIHSEAVDASLL